MIHKAFHRLHPQMKPLTDIGHRAVGQMRQDILLERRGLRAVVVMPGAALGGDLPVFTMGTAVVLRPVLNEHHTPKRR